MRVMNFCMEKYVFDAGVQFDRPARIGTTSGVDRQADKQRPVKKACVNYSLLQQVQTSEIH